jgi:dTDP-glucose 4,6-dehydratase/UDP-glucose 4-epimerase
MNILILGSEGFIGSHLVEYFLSKNFTVFGCDLKEGGKKNYHYLKADGNDKSWDKLFAEIQYDFCINAAGNGNVSYSVAHPLNDFKANCYDVAAILDAIRRLQPTCKYLHLSSAAVYGNPQNLPVTENEILKPVSPYGWHKLISEQICTEFHTLYKLNALILRPFSVFGDGLRKQLFWDIYTKAKANPTEIELWGTGSETRDFIYISDLVQCVDILLHKGSYNACVYNIASGVETTVSHAAHCLLKRLYPEISIRFNNNTREGDPLRWKADISKLIQLGFRPAVNFEIGIEKLAIWLQNQN